VGTTIYNGIKATDIDAGVNGAVEYFVVESNVSTDATTSIADGFGTFAISYPHQGHVSSSTVLTTTTSLIDCFYL
jgi:protocadherin-15